jgi:hypothetical protein
MATTTPQGVFGTKPVEQLIEQADSGTGLRRAVGALDLTALGIGAVIGTGIFSISLPDAIVSPPGDGGTVNLTAASSWRRSRCCCSSSRSASARSTAITSPTSPRTGSAASPTRPR